MSTKVDQLHLFRSQNRGYQSGRLLVSPGYSAACKATDRDSEGGCGGRSLLKTAKVAHEDRCRNVSTAWGGLASQHSATTNTSLFYDFDLSGNATVLVNASGQPVQNYYYSGFAALGSTSLAKSRLGPPMQVRGMDEGTGGLKANPAAEAYYNPLQPSGQHGLQDIGNGMN